jgi:HTH-type transcriptional regulator/antitoxin HigA
MNSFISEQVMDKVTKEQYEFALARIEELLLLVDDNTPANDKKAVELSVMSDIVVAYENVHSPIGKPTVAGY